MALMYEQCSVKFPSIALCLFASVLLLLISWEVNEANEFSPNIIKHLPGFEGTLPFSLETGYVGVGESEEFQLFYYFVESEEFQPFYYFVESESTNPKEAPLFIWMTGGPCCSSMVGLATEMGPFTFKRPLYDGSLPSITLNPHSWTKIVSIIFLDQPVGTGFSYASVTDYNMGDSMAAKLVHQFIRKWLNDHPLFVSSPLYVAGDSYSGQVVPVIVKEIWDEGIEAGEQPPLNLKGYILGNPRTDRRYDIGSRVSHIHGMALISDELYEAAKISCGGDYTNTGSLKCKEAVEAVYKCIAGINSVHILETDCFSKKTTSDVGRQAILCDEYILSEQWANNDSVQQALNVHKGSIRKWKICDTSIPYTKDITSAIEYHRKLSSKGYRTLVYSGDHDFGHIAGFTRTYSNNMTFATIKGGGHTAPTYKPEECFKMIQRWVFGNPL
ncbi:hypothetical protein H6P81_020772 [Aristolochia fimbriata]|uniref:Uncharacterized protein n=1 Tax=Aristolochia fimbriata TaxID=158543 RepID=A0AAV7DZT5_ARIFI|nr:hypothetical protein H6P81_020772 [Aristolochia fimbriata]